MFCTFWRFVFCVQKCRLYWEHFKHVLWTEEINQGIETQVQGKGGLTHSLAWTLLEKMSFETCNYAKFAIRNQYALCLKEQKDAHLRDLLICCGDKQQM